MAPVGPHVDGTGSTYTSPPFTNTGNYNTFLPSNTWPAEAGAVLDLQTAGAIYSSPFPTHRIYAPFTNPLNGIDPIASNGWQAEAGSSFPASTIMSLWDTPSAAPGLGNEITPYLGAQGAPISNVHHHNSIPFPNAVTDDSQDKRRADSLPHSPPLKRKKCNPTGSCQETSFRNTISGQTAALMPAIDPSNASMLLASGVSFDSPEIGARPSPMSPKSSRRADSDQIAQRRVRSPPAKSRSEQRARNKTAAERCRLKTKAAAAELEATERAESSRHEQLSTTLRGLQADVFALKSEVLLHGSCDDGPIREYLDNSARSLATGCGGATVCGPGGGSSIVSPGSMRMPR